MKNENNNIYGAKKSVVLNAIHPAPYVDNWINTLRQRFEVSVVYNYANSAAKTWSNYRGEPGKVLSRMSFAKLIRIYANADLVIFSGWFERRNLLAMILLRLIPSKVVMFSDYPKKVCNNNLIALFKRILISVFIDEIFCATRSTMDWYAEKLNVPRRKLKFFPYGTSGLTNESNSSGLLPTVHYKGAPGTLRVFIANNFREVKGYATLLDGLRRLKKDGILEMFSFAIAGTGEEFETYKKEFASLGGHIELLGWLDIPEYESYLKLADIFVHASHFEPFGIPPLDAISVGTPVVVSSGVQSLCGIVENGQTGYVFLHGSGHALADMLKLAYAERERLPEIARMAQGLLKREFDPEHWLAAIERTLTVSPTADCAKL